jgi:hypothetical protein
MKKRLTTALPLGGPCCLLLLTATLKTLAQVTAFKLEDSTPVKLRLERNVSWADAQVGEKVDFDVLDEVSVNGSR